MLYEVITGDAVLEVHVGGLLDVSAGDDLSGTRFGIVGVDQQRRVVGMRAGEVEKRVGLAFMRLNEGMRHGSESRDAVAPAGEHRRAAGEAGEVGGARREQASYNFV